MRILILFALLFSFTFILLPSPVSAQLGIERSRPQPGGIVPTAGNSAQTLTTIVKNLVILFYSIGSLGFVIMLLWAAVNWILSGGDKEKIAAARKKITTALIGLFLLALSFPIINIIALVSGIDLLGNLPLRNLSDPRP